MGHRDRLLKKYEKVGLEAFHDYEIMELLLTFIIPRIDTKPIAKNLIKKFNKINNILNTSSELLMEIEGLGSKSAVKINFLKDLVSYSLREKQNEKLYINCKNDVNNYLRMHFGYKKDEYMGAFFLSNCHEILSFEVLSEGTVNRCHLYPRKLFARAFSYGAAAIILAHNHPGGSEVPSVADWKLTKEIKKAGQVVELKLLDHIIITSKKIVSMREIKEWN